MILNSTNTKKSKGKLKGNTSFVLILGTIILALLMMDLLSAPFKKESSKLFCDAEKVRSDNFIGGGYEFSGGQFQSSENAYSGKYSCKLTKEDSIGLEYNLGAPLPGSFYKASVWRYAEMGGPGFLKVEGEGPCNFKKSIQTSSKFDNGWEQLEIYFEIPEWADTCNVRIYVQHDGSAQKVYFDDLLIEPLSKDLSGTEVVFEPDVLNIKLEGSEMNIIQETRKEARARGLLINTEDSWAKGQLHSANQNEMMPVKLRLKGDWLDHLSGQKWSFRIKVQDSKAWNRLITFSVQNPNTRGFLMEWLYHEWLRREDVLTPRYDFFELLVNLKSRGLYAYEEHFDKQLPESSNRREGPILKLTEDLFWLGIDRKQTTLPENVHIPDFNENALQNAEIRPFKESKNLASESLSAQFEIAQTLLLQLKNNLKPASEIVDIDRFGKYLAIVDLMEASHSLFWINQRYYYNPITSKLEPIGYDGFGKVPDLNTKLTPIGYKVDTEDVKNDFYKYLFRDPDFFNAYLHYLNKFSSPEYLQQLFFDLDPGIAERVLYLQKEFKDYTFDKNAILNRAKKMRAIFLPSGEKNLMARSQGKNGEQQILKLANQHTFPIEIKGFGRKRDQMNEELSEPLFLFSTPNNKLKTYTETSAKVDAKFVFFQMPGTDSLMSSPIMNWKIPENETPAQIVFGSNKPLVSNELYQVQGNKVLFLKGDYTATEDIAIPAGYEVWFEPGVSLNLINKAAFLSKSPVFLMGEPDAPIRIFSQDQTANSFTVLEAGGISQVRYTSFDHMNTLQKNGWTLTGAVNFYASDVNLLGASFTNNHCEDGLNIIRSKFDMRDCVIANTFADGFDSDFCEGTMKNIRFDNTGNDAADFSGSTVTLEKVNIYNPGDKGISVGEAANITIKSAAVSKAVIGLASKDLSKVKVNWISLKDCLNAFAIYQKKPEFGTATITVDKYSAKEVQHLYQLDRGAKLYLEKKEIIGE